MIIEIMGTNNISWFESKTVWFNVFMTIVGIASALQGMDIFAKYAEVFLIVVTVGNIILRVWFTNSNIQSKS